MMRCFILFAAMLYPAIAQAQSAAASDTSRLATYATLDSLYSAGDSAGFVAAAQRLANDSTTLARLYREIASGWSTIDSLQKDTAQTAPIIEALTSPEPSPPPEVERIPGQIAFIGLLFVLFLLPKALQRFRIPGAITSLLLGAIATALDLFPHDPTLNLLSTLGIVALFLFAGLEIDARELRANVRPLVIHAVVWTLLATVVAVITGLLLHVPARVAALLALALVTPSTGFILSSLSQFGLNKSEQRSVRTYAVGSELIALAALFFVLQSTSFQHLVVAIAAMLGIVLVIPVAFRGFALLVAPHAPKSEFAFLLLVAVVCAYATRLLGVYYLVGAFLVGVAAQRYRTSHPAMSSEKMIDALESFGSVFIPFYFFHAGMGIVREHLTLESIALGIGLVAVLVPIRIATVSIHRRAVLREDMMSAVRPASAMIPTLVFTLVLTEILSTRFEIAPVIAGALVIYTVVNTAIPGFVLRGEPADFEDVEALPIGQALREG